MTTTHNVFDEMNLFITEDKFYIEPISQSDNILVLDRVTAQAEANGTHTDLPNGVEKKVIYGILGVIQLIAGPYLLVVTGRTKIGNLYKKEIYRLDSIEIISFARKLTHLNENQTRIEREYLSMVEAVFSTPHFYFSYTYDLSHSVQRLHNTSPQFLNRPMYQRAEKKFVWNEHLLNEFAKSPGVSSFCLPLIHGFVSITPCLLNGKSFSLVLLSRRSKERAGVRLFTRGINSAGQVANFVETEQIVEVTFERASFVQIRGSMPFFWQQYPNLKLKPKPNIVDSENHLVAFNSHFDSLIAEYGRQIIVNLIDHKRSEGKLEEYFRKLVNLSGNHNIKYEAFDFHKECSKMRYDRLKILIDRLSDDLEQMSLMMTVADGMVVSEQDGVFRTNCIDCLDRTNVVQSMLARRSLTFVLQKLSILRNGQSVEDNEGLERTFKSVWSDHADLISLQYSGTGALKTDFTRTGKRTKSGLLRDGINSLSRYFKNNFQHGFKQDAIDLVLGNYKVMAEEGIVVKSPLEISKDLKYTAFPLILLVAIAMFFANVITPSEYTTGTLLSLMFWASMVSATLSVIFYYGSEYVDYPRLCPIQVSSTV